jgi:hypothetical protein
MMPILISHHDSRGDDDDADAFIPPPLTTKEMTMSKSTSTSLEKTIKNKKVVVATIETPEKERKANVSCTHKFAPHQKSRFICLRLPSTLKGSLL